MTKDINSIVSLKEYTDSRFDSLEKQVKIMLTSMRKMTKSKEKDL